MHRLLVEHSRSYPERAGSLGEEMIYAEISDARHDELIDERAEGWRATARLMAERLEES